MLVPQDRPGGLAEMQQNLSEGHVAWTSYCKLALLGHDLVHLQCFGLSQGRPWPANSAAAAESLLWSSAACLDSSSGCVQFIGSMLKGPTPINTLSSTNGPICSCRLFPVCSFEGCAAAGWRRCSCCCVASITLPKVCFLRLTSLSLSPACIPSRHPQPPIGRDGVEDHSVPLQRPAHLARPRYAVHPH